MANSRSSSSCFGFAAPPTSFSDQVLVPMASSGQFIEISKFMKGSSMPNQEVNVGPGEKLQDDMGAEKSQLVVDVVGLGELDETKVPEDLEPRHEAVDTTDIIIRVYHMKLLKYLQKIKTGKVFGTVLAVVHPTEFQKRGLPHAHILVWQKKDNDHVPHAHILVWQKKDNDHVLAPAFINLSASTAASELIDISVDTPAAAITNTMETALAEPPRLEMEALYLQQIKNAITYLSKLEMDA
ncbi:hypothetical protein D1007_45420 [Hordeum vulgare]|nr:hypothetical protein D1007_45420 [Hordeum vulgare]